MTLWKSSRRLVPIPIRSNEALMRENFIKPDKSFVKEIIGRGGDSVKKCYQCSNCSVICALSSEDKPFPRKEMIWAQWGLRDRLMKDPDIWLCYHCTDCSTYCPRGAKPGDVLAAIRSYAITHYASPRFLGKALSSPKYLPALLSFTALLFLGFLWAFGDLAFPAGEISTRHFIPLTHGYIGMGILVALDLAFVVVGLARFELEISPSAIKHSLPKSFFSALGRILKHSDFLKCETNRMRYLAHLGIFYGCALLLLAALFGAISHGVGVESPYPLTSPVKVAGNLGALFLIGGLILNIINRLRQSSTVVKTTYSDWFLILILLFTALSGVATEVLRLSGLAAATYTLYAIHLWLMFTLFLYGPFYKGAHLIYRPLAMVYAEQIGRT